MIHALYPAALGRGISPDQFWGASVKELLTMIESYDKHYESNMKDRTLMDFALADVIANRVGIVFTDKNKRSDDDVVMPWDYYPELFENEKKLAQEKKEASAAALHSAQMRAFAARWNNRRKG